MNYAEIKQFVKSQLRENTSELDALLELHINLALRKFSRSGNWPALRVDGESFSTTASTQTYAAPYPIERLVEDGMRYDVTSTRPGAIIPNATAGAAMLYKAGAASTITPQSVSLIAGSGADFYNTGTVVATNRGTTVTGTGTTFTSAMAGKWIVFHTDATNNGGDYGYKIATFTSTTSIALASPYRGPTLSGARYSITPGNGPRLQFDPLFTEGGKTISYSWYRKPARLYNDEDLPEVQPLGDAVAYDALAALLMYHKEPEMAQAAKGQARSEFIRAKSMIAET